MADTARSGGTDPAREAGSETAPVTTGRPLAEDGRPAGGPALELDPDSRAAGLFADSPFPLVSDPATRTWAALLATPDGDGRDRPVLLQWLAPDASEPPAHVHTDDETFEAVDGTLTVVLDGDPVTLAPGETLTVDPGVEHTFRNDTGEYVAFRAELPSMRTVRGLYTVWGLIHETTPAGTAASEYSQPGPLVTLPVAADLHDETTMTAAPVALQRLLWATVVPVVRALDVGPGGVADRYLDATFWRQRVEQPDLV